MTPEHTWQDFDEQGQICHWWQELDERKLYDMDIIIALVIVGLIAWGLERNRRHDSQPRGRLAGTTDIVDRDRDRFLSDIRAIL
jgi:hypothetical protein